MCFWSDALATQCDLRARKVPAHTFSSIALEVRKFGRYFFAHQKMPEISKTQRILASLDKEFFLCEINKSEKRL